MANGWFVREFSGMEDTLTLDSIACALTVRKIYAKVTFEA